MTLPLLLVALGHAQPLMLDAGPIAGPVQDGFHTLHPAGSDDARASWTLPPRRADVLPGPDPLRTDELTGGRLHLDLRPGAWDIWFIAGTSREDARVWAGTTPLTVLADDEPLMALPRDQPWNEWLDSRWYAAAPRPVFRDGETGWHRQVREGRPWRQVRVVVDDDGVDLEFRGLPLHALAAWSADETAMAEVDLALIDAASAAWFERHRAPHRAGPSLDEGSLGATWATEGGEPTAPWSPHLAMNDRVHRLLRVEGGDEPGTVTVDAPDGLEVTIREATWLDFAGHRQRSQRPRPTVLGAEPAWLGGQGLPPMLSVAVGSKGVAKGKHPVRIHLIRGGETHTVSFVAQVHDTHLVPGPPAGLFLQVRQEATVRTGEGSDTVRRLLDDALTLLTDRGMSALALRYATWPGTTETDLLEHVAMRWRSLGGRALMWSDAKLAWRRQAFRRSGGPVLADEEATRALLDRATAAGAVVHTYEEEAWRGVHALDRAPALFTALRRLRPDGPPLAATVPSALDLPVADPADVVLLTGPHLAEHARATKERARVWAYNLAPGRGGPLQAWAAGAETFLQWHAGSRSADPFDTTGQPVQWTHMVLHPDGRFRSTVQLEELAAGVFDVRLLATLEACAIRLSQDERDLMAWRRTLSTAQPTPASDARPWDHAILDDLRAAVLRRLDRTGNPRCAPPSRGEP